MLDVVQLTDAADERVKGYSLGMRQRLGIAAALLKQPAVLILDEPSNGLDPAGMREVRQLLRTLGDSGVTVLLSSHLLGEVQQICDTVTIINHGRVVTAGPVDEVLQSQSTGALAVGIADAARALEVLVAAGFSAHLQDGRILVDRVDDGAVVAKALADAQLYPSWLMPQQVDLEQAFLAITADEGEAVMSIPVLERRPTHHALPLLRSEISRLTHRRLVAGDGPHPARRHRLHQH